jgi:hypothetical protein
MATERCFSSQPVSEPGRGEAYSSEGRKGGIHTIAKSDLL